MYVCTLKYPTGRHDVCKYDDTFVHIRTVIIQDFFLHLARRQLPKLLQTATLSVVGPVSGREIDLARDLQNALMQDESQEFGVSFRAWPLPVLAVFQSFSRHNWCVFTTHEPEQSSVKDRRVRQRITVAGSRCPSIYRSA